MNICIAGSLAGAVGLYTRSLTEALVAADAGLRVQLVHLDDGDMIRHERVASHRVPRHLRLPTHPGWIADAARFRRAIRCLPTPPDLVHFTDARHALFATGLGPPAIGTMNDYYYAATDWWPDTVRRYYRDWVPRYLLYNTTRLLERYALRRLAHVIAVSDAVAEIVGPAYGIPPTRFTTVRYGFDFSAFPPNDGTVKSPPMVLFVGGNFQRKGLLILLRAVPAVLARHPRTKLLIAGRSLYDWGARRLAHQLGVAGNCEFLGHVDHARIGAYFSSSTVFAMPSLIEAFGIPYLEAMSCGLPVVATSCPGPDEFLVDGQNALLVPPGDADSLAHALCRLLCDTALRARLRQGGKDTAKLFSPERMASETLAVYERVLHAYRGA